MGFSLHCIYPVGFCSWGGGWDGGDRYPACGKGEGQLAAGSVAGQPEARAVQLASGVDGGYHSRHTDHHLHLQHRRIPHQLVHLCQFVMFCFLCQIGNFCKYK
jgi:hypothetical protein